jgi:hypothetical protein
MCRISTSQTPRAAVSPRSSAGARTSAGHRAEVDALLRELAYVYRLAERVREEILPGGGMTRAEVAG